MLTAVAAVLVAAGTCAVPTEVQIRNRFAQWVEAYQRHDLNQTMAIFAPNVLFQFQGAPDRHWEDLQAGYMRQFANPSSTTWVPVYEDVLLSGDLAAVFAHWTAFRAERNGERKIIAQNRSVDLLQRAANCSWKIVRSMNYPVAATAAPRSQSKP